MRSWRSCIVSRAVIVFLLSCFLSCAPRPAVLSLDPEKISAASLIGLVRSAGARLQSMTGRGSVTYESPETSGSAFFSVTLKKPDSLLVRLEGPFGINVGTFFLSRERYLMYNSMENKVITGDPATGTMRAVIPFDVTQDQLLDVFSGTFPITGDPGTAHNYSMDAERVHLELQSGDDVCEYWIDPYSLSVRRYERKDRQGRLIASAEADALTEQDGVYAARRINITFPLQDRRLSVYYTTLSLNEPNPSFAFSIPASAQTTVR